jgi:hypothetical protein
MKLVDIAKVTLAEDKSDNAPEVKLYLAGWYMSEWTCAKCGLMIGKNLKGESPFLLARQHSVKCADLRSA